MFRGHVLPGIARRSLCALIAGLACASFSWPCHAAQAEKSGLAPSDVNAVWARVTLYRDGWGTPHVIAADPFALAFAFGWAQAQDHLEAMLMAYRVANGTAAEVLGEPMADSDEFSLKMRHADLALEAIGRADPVTKDLCQGFALGANAWMAAHPDLAPAWADGVRPEDILALLHCYLMSFAPFDLPDMYARPPASASGNAWALGPALSETGEPLLVINPHEPYDGPFLWYEADLSAPGYHMAGATLFGLPVLLMGHNEALGWALTPNWPDFADMFLEVAPESSEGASQTHPLLGETLVGLLAAQYAREYVVQTPAGPERRTVECLPTERGPLMGRYQGMLCVLQAGGYGDFGGLAQLYAMGCAQHLDAFQRALDMHQLPCFHIVYADREGNIFYLYNAKVCQKHPPGPVERPGSGESQKEKDEAPPLVVDWSRPVPGDDPLFAWGGLVPPANLPAVVNPDSGYVQACGNPPWTATDAAGLWPAEWPEGLALDEDTAPARRVRHLLSFGPLSFHEVQAMLYDVLAPAAMTAVPHLLTAAEMQKEFVGQLHPDLPHGLDLLRDWNFVAESTSTGMTFFHVWWAAFRAMTLGADMAMDPLDALAKDDGEMQQTALRAASEAAKLMRNEFQSLDVPWGSVHLLRRGERDAQMGGAGAGSTVFVASDTNYERRAWRVNYGYGYAMVVKFGETPEAVSVLPFGASEEVDSPHFADQLDLMAERRFKVVRFLEDDVRREAQSAFGCRIVLDPMGMEGQFTLHAQEPIRARLSVTTGPPAPLPKGLVPFTVCARVEKRPEDAPAAVEMKIHVPEELCAASNASKLAIYAYSAELGWTPIEGARAKEANTLIGKDRQARTYVVLGPASARAGNQTPEMFIPKPKMSPAEQPAGPGGEPAQQALTIPGVSDIVLPERVELPDELKNTAVPVPEPANPEAPAQGEAIPMPTPVRPEMPQSEPAPEQESRIPDKHLGAIAWGANVELDPPDVTGHLSVKAAKPVGVRVNSTDTPPAPLPEGIVAYSKFIVSACSAKDVPLDVQIDIAIQGDACPPDARASLKLYAYDPEAGWRPLAAPGQGAPTPGGLAFTASDTATRTYAILGAGTAPATPAPAASEATPSSPPEAVEAAPAPGAPAPAPPAPPAESVSLDAASGGATPEPATPADSPEPEAAKP